jgi:chemotaxis protein CheY-P-specific phosphatase CheC
VTPLATAKRSRAVTTEEVLLILCHSVTEVLGNAGNKDVSYSPMVQKINKTCLRPDIGCFVLFDGGFSGLVIINFTATSAMEIYRKYLLSMGMPEDELAQYHTADEVGNVMGEIMNQIVGDFTNKVRHQLKTSITQSQPKMMAINKQVQISVNTTLDQPQSRRVTFNTDSNNIFYLELSMDKTEFIKLHDFDETELEDPDEILAENREKEDRKAQENTGNNDNDDLMNDLGI